MSRLGPQRAGVWADALTIVSIVAIGVCVAALVERGAPPEQPENRAESVATTTTHSVTAGPSAPVDTTYRTPEVIFPTAISGCDVVEPPDGTSSVWGRITTSEDAYDNPQASWYSGPRSVMMTDAVAEALPHGVEVLFASLRESLVFQPIPQTSSEPGQPQEPGWATASAELGRGNTLGLLAVSVAQDNTGVPPCRAGSVQERTTSADGTVVDTNVSWSEFGGTRTNYRTVTAYAPDGTHITATASDAHGFQSTNTGDRDIVLTIDELKALVTLPELRISAPVPADTPEPREGCDDSFGLFSGDTAIDAELATNLNTALERVGGGERFDPGLNTLRLADFETGVVCTHVDAVGTGADLSISIRGGQELPVMPDIYDPAYQNRPTDFETLDGGAVLRIEEAPYSYSPALPEGPNGGMRRTVTVTYPSGTEVEVRSHAERPDEPLSANTLRTIATADGLDVL
ncbi:MAG: hypothetical protein ACK40J_05855 [Rhodococcus sp. (in: high G+C Gram-positive bacteria)]